MASWENLDDHLDSVGCPHGPPTLGGTTGGGHARGSYHYDPPGSARDYGTALNGGVDGCWAIYNTFLPWAQGPDYRIIELIWRDIFFKYGRLIGPTTGHWDHVHAALKPGSLLPVTPPAPRPPPESQIFEDLLLE
jgi:hypothetical protein